MLRSLIEHVVMVVIAATISIWFVNAFDDWYQHNRRVRQARWERRQARYNHPTRQGGRNHE